MDELEPTANDRPISLIASRQLVNGEFKYKVKWKNPDKEKFEWVDASSLKNSEHLVEELVKRYPRYSVINTAETDKIAATRAALEKYRGNNTTSSSPAQSSSSRKFPDSKPEPKPSKLKSSVSEPKNGTTPSSKTGPKSTQFPAKFPKDVATLPEAVNSSSDVLSHKSKAGTARTSSNAPSTRPNLTSDQTKPRGSSTVTANNERTVAAVSGPPDSGWAELIASKIFVPMISAVTSSQSNKNKNVASQASGGILQQESSFEQRKRPDSSTLPARDDPKLRRDNTASGNVSESRSKLVPSSGGDSTNKEKLFELSREVFVNIGQSVVEGGDLFADERALYLNTDQVFFPILLASARSGNSLSLIRDDIFFPSHSDKEWTDHVREAKPFDHVNLTSEITCSNIADGFHHRLYFHVRKSNTVFYYDPLGGANTQDPAFQRHTSRFVDALRLQSRVTGRDQPSLVILEPEGEFRQKIESDQVTCGLRCIKVGRMVANSEINLSEVAPDAGVLKFEVPNWDSKHERLWTNHSLIDIYEAMDEPANWYYDNVEYANQQLELELESSGGRVAEKDLLNIYERSRKIVEEHSESYVEEDQIQESSQEEVDLSTSEQIQNVESSAWTATDILNEIGKQGSISWKKALKIPGKCNGEEAAKLIAKRFKNQARSSIPIPEDLLTLYGGKKVKARTTPAKKRTKAVNVKRPKKTTQDDSAAQSKEFQESNLSDSDQSGYNSDCTIASEDEKELNALFNKEWESLQLKQQADQGNQSTETSPVKVDYQSKVITKQESTAVRNELSDESRRDYYINKYRQVVDSFTTNPPYERPPWELPSGVYDLEKFPIGGDFSPTSSIVRKFYTGMGTPSRDLDHPLSALMMEREDYAKELKRLGIVDSKCDTILDCFANDGSYLTTYHPMVNRNAALSFEFGKMQLFGSESLTNIAPGTSTKLPPGVTELDITEAAAGLHLLTCDELKEFHDRILTSNEPLVTKSGTVFHRISRETLSLTDLTVPNYNPNWAVHLLKANHGLSAEQMSTVWSIDRSLRKRASEFDQNEYWRQFNMRKLLNGLPLVQSQPMNYSSMDEKIKSAVNEELKKLQKARKVEMAKTPEGLEALARIKAREKESTQKSLAKKSKELGITPKEYLERRNQKAFEKKAAELNITVKELLKQRRDKSNAKTAKKHKVTVNQLQKVQKLKSNERVAKRRNISVKQLQKERKEKQTDGKKPLLLSKLTSQNAKDSSCKGSCGVPFKAGDNAIKWGKSYYHPPCIDRVERFKNANTAAKTKLAELKEKQPKLFEVTQSAKQKKMIVH